MSLPMWEKLPQLRRNYLRLLAPGGTTDDVYRGDLEAALEARDTPHQIFTPKDWEAFLQRQRKVAVDWDLRNTFTGADRRFLDSLNILWEPETFRRARWRANHAHDDDFLFTFAASLQELPVEQQEQLRNEIYERTTRQPYRPR
jgi:hypothetical protein